jgi:long-chain acyl-CoA synthetase
MSSISSIGDIARVHAANTADKVALIYQERQWTYGQLDNESNRVANALLAAGVNPQDRVAHLDKNGPEYFTYLIGASKVNAVSMSVNWRLAAPEMEYVLNHAEAKVLLIGEEFLGHFREMDVESVTTVVVVGNGGEYVSYDNWIAASAETDPEIAVGWTDTCYQLYTSGTTGLPKGVELTNRNFFSFLPVASEEWYFDSDSVNLVAMPLFHIAGSGWGVVGLFNGGTNVLLREADLVELLQLVETYQVTNALLVPAILQFLLITPEAQETNFSSLRCMIYGASPITEEVLSASMELMGCDFVGAYGLTETTGGGTLLRAEHHDPGGPRAHLLRSAGQPWADIELRIVDPETFIDLGDNEVGEIWIKSVVTLKSYWKDPDATDEAYPEGRDAEGLGWFRTGDAGYMSEGFLFIHDRVKDMIISGAENIYPAEVENALMSHPDIADVAVIGVPDEKWGETVKALITPAEGADPSEADLIEHCRGRLAHYKCPTSVDRISMIPRNPSGKILKTELRKPYWDGEQRRVN